MDKKTDNIMVRISKDKKSRFRAVSKRKKHNVSESVTAYIDEMVETNGNPLDSILARRKQRAKQFKK